MEAVVSRERHDDRWVLENRCRTFYLRVVVTEACAVLVWSCWLLLCRRVPPLLPSSLTRAPVSNHSCGCSVILLVSFYQTLSMSTPWKKNDG